MENRIKILVIGGNRFFGKRLVDKLITDGHQVTVLNRGKLPTHPKAEFIQANRSDFRSFAPALMKRSWDIVYDQVCMDYQDALLASEILAPKTSRYVMISTVSVYPWQAPLKEKDFDPWMYQFSDPTTVEKDYANSKRQAEATLVQSKKFSSIALVRIPIVLGPDDYTQRLKFHVDRIKNSLPLFFPNIKAKMCYIHAEDAAINIKKLGEMDLAGPINLASKTPLSMQELVSLIEKTSHKKAVIAKESNPDIRSPFGVENDWYPDVSLAEKNHLACTPLELWLPEVIKSYV